MLALFEEVADTLRSAADGRQIVYIPNPGNFGDALIRYGTKQFFADFEIRHVEINVGYSRVRYQLLPLLLKSRRYFFVYGGGGAWSPAYGFGQAYCRYIARFTDQFLVLPSTYSLPHPPNCGFMYRRDKAESAEWNPRSRFCHDMAFYVACRNSPHRPRFPAPASPFGIFMRTDRESRFPAGSVPAANVDISLAGDHMSNGDDFIARIAAHETVYTDRLHVCIAACIAGRRVKLITGNYFKIRSIYEASLAPQFSENVELVGERFTLDDLPTAGNTA